MCGFFNITEIFMDTRILPGERLDFVNENISLIQKSDGLTFGTDAYLLAAMAAGKGRGCDLGAGTGIASLLCAASGKCEKIYAVEIQDEFFDLCQRNASLNRLHDKVIPINKDVREIMPADTGGEVDFVISNPPYMSADSGRGNVSDMKNIARREVFGTISDFAAAAARILRYGGDFYVVYRPERLCELTDALRHAALEPKDLVLVCPTATSAPSLVLVRARKFGRPGLRIAPPLIIYRERGTPPEAPLPAGERDLGYTESFARIYRDFSLDHILRQRRKPR